MTVVSRLRLERLARLPRDVLELVFLEMPPFRSFHGLSESAFAAAPLGETDFARWLASLPRRSSPEAGGVVCARQDSNLRPPV